MVDNREKIVSRHFTWFNF